MKNNIPAIYKLAIIISLSISLASNSYAQDPLKVQRIKEAVDSVRITYEKYVNRTCPSLSILINTPTDHIFVSSTAEGVSPLTKDTYFRFASNTKSFTASSILNMQESGWLNIKDRITDFIPGTTMPYVPMTPAFNIPFKNEITIELLLQHAAGVYDVDNDTVPGFHGYSITDYMDFTNPSYQFELSELVEQDAKFNLYYFQPGKGYHYSNTGFTILSEIIERIYSLKSGSEKKYADYIYDFITGPTAPVPLDISFPYLATDLMIREPYVKGNLWAKDSTVIFTTVNMSAHVGEGNGYATFSELEKYIRTLMKGENVLTSESVQLMKHTVSEANKNYGLGCINITDLGYGHNGCIKGYLSFMLYDPATDISVIIMMPVNDYRYGDERGIEYGLKALVNAGYAAKIVLGYPGKLLEY